MKTVEKVKGLWAQLVQSDLGLFIMAAAVTVCLIALAIKVW